VKIKDETVKEEPIKMGTPRVPDGGRGLCASRQRGASAGRTAHWNGPTILVKKPVRTVMSVSARFLVVIPFWQSGSGENGSRPSYGLYVIFYGWWYGGEGLEVTSGELGVMSPGVRRTQSQSVAAIPDSRPWPPEEAVYGSRSNGHKSVLHCPPCFG
jgi:hypothetical protein